MRFRDFGQVSRTIGVVAATALSAVGLSHAQSTAPDTSAQRGEDSVQRVKSLSDLKPTLPGDLARARELNDWTRVSLTQWVNRGGGEWGNDGSDGHRTASGVDLSGRIPTPDELFREEVCNAYAIVVGRPVERRTFTTETVTWLFTDYDVAVDRWIRRKADVAASAEILIGDSGGEVEVDGSLLRMMNGPVPLFRTSQDYLIFLKRLKQSDAFRVVNKPPVSMNYRPGQSPTHAAIERVVAAAVSCA